jgi:hypothetical protein
MLAAAQVVDALAALVNAQAAVAGRVKTSRTWPWAEDQLPAARVFVSDEVAAPVTMDGVHEHRLAVDVQYTTRAVADLDDAMHTLAADGLTLLFAGTPPYGLSLSGISRETATEGEAAVGRITLQLQCLFHAAPSAPETIL